MYDTDIAIAMEHGKIEGVVDKGDYYLVNLRITGTGVKTRIIDGQAVEIDRPAEYFLSAHFLQECRGLPVTVEHPEERVNKQTFSECVIGTVFHPYIKGEEVWGVAKIYNTPVIKEIIATEPSTSPNVLSANLFFKHGEPRIEDYESINHVAIVREGFWDNGYPAIITKEGDMEEKKDNLSKEAILAEIERDDRLRDEILRHLHREEKDKKDEDIKRDTRDSLSSLERVDAQEKIDEGDSKEAMGKEDDMSKEAQLAESERDNRLEKDAEKDLHEREKDKKDSDIDARIAELEAQLAELRSVEQREGDEWEILAEEHEELSDEYMETECLEEEMIDTKDALYEGVKSTFKVLRAGRREMPEKYMLRSIRANERFLSEENRQVAFALNPKQHKQAVRRLYNDFKDSIKQANIKSVGDSDADIPLVRKENGIIYEDNYLHRIMKKVGGK